jgi:hypothetical protein
LYHGAGSRFVGLPGFADGSPITQKFSRYGASKLVSEFEVLDNAIPGRRAVLERGPIAVAPAVARSGVYQRNCFQQFGLPDGSTTNTPFLPGSNCLYARLICKFVGLSGLGLDFVHSSKGGKRSNRQGFLAKLQRLVIPPGQCAANRGLCQAYIRIFCGQNRRISCLALWMNPRRLTKQPDTSARQCAGSSQWSPSSNSFYSMEWN